VKTVFFKFYFIFSFIWKTWDEKRGPNSANTFFGEHCFLVQKTGSKFDKNSFFFAFTFLPSLFKNSFRATASCFALLCVHCTHCTS